MGNHEENHHGGVGGGVKHYLKDRPRRYRAAKGEDGPTELAKKREGGEAQENGDVALLEGKKTRNGI